MTNHLINSYKISLIIAICSIQLIAQQSWKSPDVIKRELETKYRLALQFERQGQIDRALDVYRYIFKQDPKNTNYYSRYTYRLFNQKSYDELSKFRFTHTLLYAYLKLIQEDCTGDNVLLIRAPDGRPVTTAGDSKIMFDSRGGVFVYDPLTRRKLFKYRCTMLMSLFDMATKEKEPYIIESLYPNNVFGK